jgi:hypothetical protein
VLPSVVCNSLQALPHPTSVSAVFPSVVCNSLQALPHPTSVGAGVVRFDLSPVLTLFLFYASSEGKAGFLISFRVIDELTDEASD